MVNVVLRPTTLETATEPPRAFISASTISRHKK
jgi:hypothetical protein